jgi:protein-S-isoprenylcysteine O-methyltransferase Ste14
MANHVLRLVGLPMASDARDIRRWMFTYRSYTPLPFLVVMILFARPTLVSLVLGAFVMALGEGLRFWGVSIAGSETRTTGTVGGTYLITNGPFAHLRNPLYLGNILMYTGVGIMSMALFPWLLLIAVGWFFLQYSLIIASEEEYLTRRFGEAYQRYRGEVRRFLPQLTPYRSPDPPAKGIDLKEGLASEKRTLQAITLVTILLVAMYVIRRSGG